ncbi:MAG: hypothetical protein ABI758_02125 [Candidatus Woesebacteria bacterium]
MAEANINGERDFHSHEEAISRLLQILQTTRRLGDTTLAEDTDVLPFSSGIRSNLLGRLNVLAKMRAAGSNRDRIVAPPNNEGKRDVTDRFFLVNTLPLARGASTAFSSQIEKVSEHSTVQQMNISTTMENGRVGYRLATEGENSFQQLFHDDRALSEVALEKGLQHIRTGEVVLVLARKPTDATKISLDQTIFEGNEPRIVGYDPSGYFFWQP